MRRGLWCTRRTRGPGGHTLASGSYTRTRAAVHTRKGHVCSPDGILQESSTSKTGGGYHHYRHLLPGSSLALSCTCSVSSGPGSRWCPCATCHRVCKRSLITSAGRRVPAQWGPGERNLERVGPGCLLSSPPALLRLSNLICKMGTWPQPPQGGAQLVELTHRRHFEGGPGTGECPVCCS